jgi:RNA polymerase sigma-70 factor (ECF subfamily)
LNDRVEAVAMHRPRLFGLAYRMLGSAAEAEDVVQDAFARWYSAPRDDVRDEAAFLVTTVTRLCFDHLKSARVRREVYVGEWLAEPIAVAPGELLGEPFAHTQESAEHELERLESISLAFLALLDTLTPLERAVYLLHDVFDYGFAAVGAIVGRNEAACRQVHRRAKLAIRSRRTSTASPERHRELLAAFLAACRDGDLDGLQKVLAEHVVARADGGGKAAAANRSVVGAVPTARLYVGLVRRYGRGIEMEIRAVNGWPTIVATEGRVLRAAIQAHSDGERIDALYAVTNPDKLVALATALDLAVDAP